MGRTGSWAVVVLLVTTACGGSGGGGAATVSEIRQFSVASNPALDGWIRSNGTIDLTGVKFTATVSISLSLLRR